MFIFDSINNNDMLAPFIYFDGELERRFGYDITAVVSGAEMKTIKTKNGFYQTPIIPIGTFDVQVIGIDEKCQLFTWDEFGNTHGYIVLSSDSEAVKRAKENQYRYR